MDEEDTVDVLGSKNKVCTERHTCYLILGLGSIGKNAVSVRKL